LPFREPTLALRDILAGIDMIVQFVNGMDLEAFREDTKTVAAASTSIASRTIFTGADDSRAGRFEIGHRAGNVPAN
jgi:hypothetical protein